ncbi:MAG TPA: arginine deiminase-related protein [Caulobacteraceae bacterium]|nr:arginine deiminase-related protein [Caulobacteraceae bacterium]
MTKPLILMTDPAWFDVSYEINPWMRPGVWGADAKAHSLAARKAFDALVAALEGAGAAVEMIGGAPGLPDMVFAANAAVVLDRKVLVARFRPAERRGEEPRFVAAFQALKARGLVDQVAQIAAANAQGAVFQEGAGDAIWDACRGHFWTGFGQRSTRAASAEIAAFFGRDVVPLELASPRFYHLDTCFCPLSGGEVLYYPPAFTPASLAEIRRRVPASQLIEASDADAAALCVNAVSIGRTIVMAKAPAGLTRTLQARGYRIAEVDLAPFILSGGAAFCLTLRLDLVAAHAAAEPAVA